MRMLQRFALAGAVAAMLSMSGPAASADDVLRFASTGIGWDNSVTPSASGPGF